MNFVWLTLSLFFLSEAHAAVETYSATETGSPTGPTYYLDEPVALSPETEPSPRAPVTVTAERARAQLSQKKKRMAQASLKKRSVPQKTPVSAPVQPQMVAQPKLPSFDPVPGHQTEALIKRLQLTQELIRKYGRAYDYRTHTSRELELILDRLDSQAGERAPLPPPATPAASVHTAPNADQG